MAASRTKTSAPLSDSVARFLDALGLPAEVRAGGDLIGTPERVAEAWREDLIDGYRHDPADVLAETMPSSSGDLVAVTRIDYHSICPHHLLPSRGLAHVAYVPGGKVVGFGQVVRLVDCLSHRLILEEDLARQVAQAFLDHVGARGAACVLDAEQFCMTVRGERRRETRAHAQAFLGALDSDVRFQRRFLALIAEPRARRIAGGGAKRSARSKRAGRR